MSEPNVKLPARGDELALTLESLDDDGLAVARLVVGARKLKAHVRGGVPGDRVVARIDSRLRDALFGRVARVDEASPDRQPSACQHLAAVAPCGGCALQAMTYEAQLHHKAERVRRHLGNLSVAALVAPTLAAPTTFHHRHKMELTFGKDRDNRMALGQHPSGYRWEILTVSGCLLVTPWAAAFLPTILALAEAHGLDALDVRTQVGVLRNLVIREGKRTRDRLIEVLTSPALEPAQGRAFVEALAAAAGDAVSGIVWTVVRAERGQPTRMEQAHAIGRPWLEEELHLPEGRRLRLGIGPRAFFQPHPLAAERLLAEVLKRLPPGGRVADLYCGTGTLALAVAPFAASVVGVELVAEAIDDARANAAKNGITHATFIAGDVAQVLGQPEHAHHFAGLDAVLLDPPRSGLMPPAFEALVRLAAPTIVYVSCNPASLARDLAALSRLGYTVEGPVQPVDLFPHSPHVESVVLLRRTAP